MANSAREHVWLMLALTFGTGINDAVGYLGLDKVFTGNMTGNVVVLGMSLTGGTGLPVLGPALAFLGFMAGAAAAGRSLRKVAGTWSGRTSIHFGIVSVLMFVLGALLLADGSHPSHRFDVFVTTGAAIAMGIQAATARLVAVQDITTVVVTSTITGLAADSRLGSGAGVGVAGGSVRRAAAVLAIMAGAATGALLLRWHLGTGLVLAGLVSASVAVIGESHRRA